MRAIASRTLVASAGLAAATSVAAAGMSYTPLAFGPLTDPGGNRYYTQVVDISADGMSYVGVLDNNDVKYVYQGTTYDVRGAGAPFGISPDGRTAVGGMAGEFAQRWDVDNASAGGIVSTDIQAAADFFVTQPAYGTNSSVSAFSMSTPTGVLTGDGFKNAEEPFGPMDPLTFAGANRGIAADAPVAVVLGFQPDVNASGYRWNYETNELTPAHQSGERERRHHRRDRLADLGRRFGHRRLGLAHQRDPDAVLLGRLGHAPRGADCGRSRVRRDPRGELHGHAHGWEHLRVGPRQPRLPLRPRVRHQLGSERPVLRRHPGRLDPDQHHAHLRRRLADLRHGSRAGRVAAGRGAGGRLCPHALARSR